jgi:hypothetical protein
MCVTYNYRVNQLRETKQEQFIVRIRSVKLHQEE